MKRLVRYRIPAFLLWKVILKCVTRIFYLSVFQTLCLFVPAFNRFFDNLFGFFNIAPVLYFSGTRFFQGLIVIEVKFDLFNQLRR